MNFLKKLIAVTSLIASSTFANAGLISVNGNSVETLQLGNTGFSTFYNFGNGNTYSANTGLELANRAVIFVAQLDTNEYGIFNIFSGLGGRPGNIDVADSGTQGQITFLDDDTETNLSFGWSWGKSDGLVYSQIFGDSWSVNLDYSNISGLEGLSIYSFDSAGNAALVFASQQMPNSVNITSVAANINSPTILSIFLLALGFIAIRKK
ncbi:MAG: hypothetical protein ACI9O6_002969 [Glaciecola sp.]|jgi:hypothetical protein